ncbi:MAG: threonine aldolase family protein [Pyramidobacter sp.]|nr:threonine aldolase family protein [Pyramidobacter sp.]
MIDLRSDTLTLPDAAMLQSILTAPLGDDGRLDAEGRGEDATVNRLEDMAAQVTGKEAALLCASGTMGNHSALLTWCRPGDTLLIDELQHLDRSEKAAFDPRIGQMKKVTYTHDADAMPDLADIERKLDENPVKLLCLENTHNYLGGMCIDAPRMAEIHELAARRGVPVHMDGARLFNAAAYLGVDVKELTRHVESVMFCVSKGLGAPVGSILCGSREFIREAKNTRKLLGGAMRQAGIIAAPAIYALEHNVERLKEDNENAQLCASLLRGLNKIKVQERVQTNILMLDVADAGVTPQEFCERAKAAGLLIRPIIGTSVRLVFYKGISRVDAENAAAIIRGLEAAL